MPSDPDADFGEVDDEPGKTAMSAERRAKVQRIAGILKSVFKPKQ